MDTHSSTENDESPIPITLYSIGHSNHSLDEFLELLTAFHIKTLVDIRSYPYSTKMTQFDMEYLEHQLLQHDITYHWFKDLGGFRKGLGEGSPNFGLKDEGMRAYADYMLSEEFHHATGRLITMAHLRRTVMMCAEKDPMRCHRHLLSDYLLIHGAEVIHIITLATQHHHGLSQGTCVTGGCRLSYPYPEDGQSTLFAMDN
jgi:uncharacterized protein (DUF488 family)